MIAGIVAAIPRGDTARPAAPPVAEPSPPPATDAIGISGGISGGVSDGISGTLSRLARTGRGDRVSFADLVDSFEIGAYGPLIVLFAAPNLLPVALPGISAVLGAPLILITAQLMLGRRRLWLPGPLRRCSVRRTDLARVVDRIAPRLERLEARLRPRLPALTGAVGRRLIGLVGLILAAVIFLPIPFGNSLPGLALVLMGVGLLARDGLMVAAGGVAAAAGLAVASGFLWGAVQAGALLARHGLGL